MTTKYFDLLPDELIIKILGYLNLIHDSGSFLNFSSCNKRLISLANELPLIYHFNNKSLKDECPQKIKSKLLQMLKREQIEYTDEVARFNCFLESKFRIYSCLKFRDYYITEKCCQLLFNSHYLYKERIDRLKKLDIIACHMSLEWLDKLLFHLNKLQELYISNSAIDCESINYEKQQFMLKGPILLKKFSIVNYASSNHLTDFTFRYFIGRISPIWFNISGTATECNQKVFRRFYINNNNLTHDDLILQKPSDYILSFAMINYYLKLNNKIIKRFTLDFRSITSEKLKALIEDNELLQMKVDVFILHTGHETDLCSKLEKGQLSRVKFNKIY